MRSDEYAEHDGLGLAGLVAGGQVTATELLAAARARADLVDPRINALFARLDDHADARVPQELTGPYAGVPFLLEHLHQHLAGEVTSGGCRALAGRVADHTSTIVQRWLDAGVVVFGKTSTPEFGSKGVTEPALFGPTRNPWDPRWTSRSGPDDPPDEFEHLWDFPDHLTDDGSWRRPRSSSVRSTAPAAPRDSA